MSLFKGIKYFLLSDNSRESTLKTILGFYPRNISLYEQAFTHKSILNENDEIEVSNERLEYLGDAILGAIVADYLYSRFPFKEEGFLTKVRSKLVSRSFLNQLSVDLGLDSFLETSVDLKRSKSIYGDAFEALIGAIYLDRGYKKCKRFVIEKVIKDFVNVDEMIQKETDFKSRLVEWSQKKRKNYKYQLQEILDGDIKYYQCELIIEGKIVAESKAKSKKEAEQIAAEEFFKKGNNP